MNEETPKGPTPKLQTHPMTWEELSEYYIFPVKENDNQFHQFLKMMKSSILTIIFRTLIVIVLIAFLILQQPQTSDQFNEPENVTEPIHQPEKNVSSVNISTELPQIEIKSQIIPTLSNHIPNETKFVTNNFSIEANLSIDSLNQTKVQAPRIRQYNLSLEIKPKVQKKEEPVYVKKIMNTSKFNEQAVRNNKPRQTLKQKLESFEKTSLLKQLQLYPICHQVFSSPPLDWSPNWFLDRLFGRSPNYRKLYEMITNKWGYWQSSGNGMTVRTSTVTFQNNHLDRKVMNMVVFVPTLFIIYLPYDIADNETLQFVGFLVQEDLFTYEPKVSKPTYLGKLQVLPTRQQKETKLAIRRVFQCLSRECAGYFNMVKVFSNNNLRLVSFRIKSVRNFSDMAYSWDTTA